MSDQEWVRSSPVRVKTQPKFCREEIEHSPLTPGWGGGRELALMDLRAFVLELELVCKAALTYLSAHVAFSVWQGML